MEATPLSAFKITGTRIDAFVGKGITDVVIPDGITEIGHHAFCPSIYSGAASIRSVYIPDTVSIIGKTAFGSNRSLVNVRLPRNLKRLEDNSFSWCENLQNINLPHGIQSIGFQVFSISGILELVIPSSVTTLDKLSLSGGTKLREITIPESVRSIGDDVFGGKKNFTIRTTTGSYIERVARAKGIPVTIITKSAMDAELAAAQEKYQKMSGQIKNAAGKTSVANTSIKQDAEQSPVEKSRVISNTAKDNKGEHEMSRKFFRIDLYNLYRFFLHERFPVSSSEMCYGSFRIRDIVVQRKTLFRDELVLKLPYSLYAYEENGTFYEFFSGKMIGERRAATNTSYYRNPDEMVRNGYTLTSFQDFGTCDYTIRELTAVKFADEVGKFVPYKSHMASEMSKLLDAIDANHKRLTDAANAKRNAEIRAEQNSQSWLDDIINRR